MLLPLVGEAASDKESRYPYDPACAWGRIANGKGMLHRCLSEAEASQIALASKVKKSADEDCEEKDKSCRDKSGKGAAQEPASDKSKSLPKAVHISLGPITADKGDLTIGRLGKPMDRYEQCVIENGGLTEKAGKVVLKFLVRAERARAEGVSVHSQKGVSKKAAKCIADVVDRRKVGAPSADMTAAKLTFEIREKK